MQETGNTILYNKIVIGLLVMTFVVYNVILYQKGAFIREDVLSSEAVSGQQIWQDNNCTACHQFYGLGGYLGPDLTNVYSDSLKSEAYIRSRIVAGTGAMPKYTFSELEIDQLLSFFKAVDRTGYFPNKKAKKRKTGWVEIAPKNTDNDKK